MDLSQVSNSGASPLKQMQAIAMSFTDQCSESITKVKDSITEFHSAQKFKGPTVGQLQSMTGGRKLQVTAVTSLGE